MRSIAVISDIHANLPALESVLADIEGREGVTGVYHLGDLVGYAPWPNEVVGLLQAAGIPGIAGNYDSTVATGYDHCGCGYEDPGDVELAHLSYAWTLNHVSEGTRSYLGSLPFRMDLRPWGGHLPGPKITLFHGNPILNTMYWTDDRSESFFLQMAGKAGAREGDVMVFGHTHKPWTRELDGIRFVNAGSVGRPKDGDWRACYVLLHLDDGAEGSGVKKIEADHIRVEYDRRRTQAAIEASELPDEFAAVLETGGG